MFELGAGSGGACLCWGGTKPSTHEYQNEIPLILVRWGECGGSVIQWEHRQLIELVG